MNHALSLVWNAVEIKRIIERCGEDPINDGIQCPHCKIKETFKPRIDTENTRKWYFMISAFKVDDSSKCTNCGKWF